MGPVTKARYLTGYAAFRVMLNSRHPLAVRQVLRKLGCDRITITRTGEHTWDFAGEFDAGCLIEKGPAESSVDPIYIVPSSAANPSKFYEIPFRGTVAEPSTRPARAPKPPPRQTGCRRPALAGAAQKRSPRPKAAP